MIADTKGNIIDVGKKAIICSKDDSGDQSHRNSFLDRRVESVIAIYWGKFEVFEDQEIVEGSAMEQSGYTSMNINRKSVYRLYRRSFQIKD